MGSSTVELTRQFQSTNGRMDDQFGNFRHTFRILRVFSSQFDIIFRMKPRNQWGRSEREGEWTSKLAGPGLDYIVWLRRSTFSPTIRHLKGLSSTIPKVHSSYFQNFIHFPLVYLQSFSSGVTLKRFVQATVPCQLHLYAPKNLVGWWLDYCALKIMPVWKFSQDSLNEQSTVTINWAVIDYYASD